MPIKDYEIRIKFRFVDKSLNKFTGLLVVLYGKENIVDRAKCFKEQLWR